jgi:hypothetical protein
MIWLVPESGVVLGGHALLEAFLTHFFKLLLSGTVGGRIDIVLGQRLSDAFCGGFHNDRQLAMQREFAFHSHYQNYSF